MTRLRRRNGLCGSCLRKSSGHKRGTGTLHLRPAYDRSERRSGWEHKVSLPAIASLGALLLLVNMARTEQSWEH